MDNVIPVRADTLQVDARAADLLHTRKDHGAAGQEQVPIAYSVDGGPSFRLKPVQHSG